MDWERRRASPVFCLYNGPRTTDHGQTRMAVPFLIIDGYNLLHAAGMARERYGPGDLERCRNELLAFLARRLSPAERRRTTIVFDAADAPTDLRRQRQHELMQVRFAPRGGDADSLIEDLVARHSAPRQVRVVSSDHRLQKAARRRRGVFLESREFFLQLDERPETTETPTRGRTSRSHPKYTGAVSPEEAARWQEFFGKIAVTDSPADPVVEPPPLPDPPAPPQEAAKPRRSRRTRKRSTPSASASPALPAATEDEVRFWQARVEELHREQEPF